MNQIVLPKTLSISTSDYVQERHVVIHDLALMASIGVYEHEDELLQPIVINVDVTLSDGTPHRDELEYTICYHSLTKSICKLVAAGHIGLVETLADSIADIIFSDPRAASAKVSVWKITAIPEARSVGVEIIRRRLPEIR